MRVSVKNGADAIAIDRFLESRGAEKGDDLRRFAFDGRLNRRVVQDSNFLRRAQTRQRGFELERLFDRLVHEVLDDLLAPGAEGTTTEAAAESLDAAEADPVDLRR